MPIGEQKISEHLISRKTDFFWNIKVHQRLWYAIGNLISVSLWRYEQYLLPPFSLMISVVELGQILQRETTEDVTSQSITTLKYLGKYWYEQL